MSMTPDSVEAMIRSDDYGQRLIGLNRLRQLDPPIAFDLLQLGIQDSNVRVRYAAVSQMGNLGEQNRAKSLEILQDLLKDKEYDIQAAAADALGALKLQEAFDDIAQLYRETPEWMVKFSIVAALGEMGDPRAFDILVDALGSTHELIKTAAIGSLGELGDQRALSHLIPYATHPDWQIRYRVVQALGQMNDPQAQELLKTLSQDSVESVAQEAKVQLGA